jgi:hypothetical protein
MEGPLGAAGDARGEASDQVRESTALTHAYMAQHQIPLPDIVETIAEIAVN